MGSVINAFNRMGDSLLSFFLKIILVMVAIAFGIAFIAILAVNWPFTISLVICIILSEPFYKKVKESTNLKLPWYFSLNIEDFLVTFTQGDEEIDQLRHELDEKKEMAEREVAVMREALRSAENQLEQIKAKRSVGNLFKRQPEEISERVAKALEMELGKPMWTQYINKANQEANSEWEDLLA